MASELINKIEQLHKKVIEFGNKRFKKKAVEILTTDDMDEDMFVNPAQIYPDMEAAKNDEPAPEPPKDLGEPHGVFADMKIEAVIRKSISEEQEAAAKYIERAAKCLKHENFPLARLFEELAGDEIVHAAALETALDMYGLFDPYKFILGQEEAEGILTESKDNIAEKEAKARAEAEKARKEFDFVAEYTKDKSTYEKEKIINSINDLILGKNDVNDVVKTVMTSAKAAKKSLEKDAKKDKKAEQ